GPDPRAAAEVVRAAIGGARVGPDERRPGSDAGGERLLAEPAPEAARQCDVLHGVRHWITSTTTTPPRPRAFSGSDVGSSSSRSTRNSATPQPAHVESANHVACEPPGLPERVMPPGPMRWRPPIAPRTSLTKWATRPGPSACATSSAWRMTAPPAGTVLPSTV